MGGIQSQTLGRVTEALRGLHGSLTSAQFLPLPCKLHMEIVSTSASQRPKLEELGDGSPGTEVQGHGEELIAWGTCIGTGKGRRKCCDLPKRRDGKENKRNLAAGLSPVVCHPALGKVPYHLSLSFPICEMEHYQDQKG